MKNLSQMVKPVLRAAGVLPVCPATEKLCLLWRHPRLEFGNCWGIPGGVIENGETPEETIRRELKEETGFDGNIVLSHLYTYRSKKIIYDTYIGLVAEEFGYYPHHLYADEHLRMDWMAWADLCLKMDANLKNFHPGIVEMLWYKQDKVKKALRYDPAKPFGDETS